MATEVYTTEIIRLQDETEVELSPLSISKMRKFTRMWTDHITDVRAKVAEATKEDSEVDYTEADLTDEQYTVMIKMAALGLESQLKGERTEKKFLEYLEDVLDEKTLHRILDRTGGLKLGDEDPNPQRNPVAVQDGTN